MDIPWRVAIIGSTPGTIDKSTLVQNLNPACELKETSWIQPGTTTFPWLTDHNCNMKPQRLRQFIDMASEMHWNWLEFDIPLVFGNTGKTTFATWMQVKWIPELIYNASSKGIKCYGWDHWENLNSPEKCEKILGWYVKHGVKGIKADFLNSDSQDRFKFRRPAGILKPAASKYVPRCACGRELIPGRRFCIVCAKERERQRKKRAYHEH
jgi:alpha-glucosidase